MFDDQTPDPSSSADDTEAAGTPHILRVAASDLEDWVPGLSALLAEIVNAGWGLGFVAPVSQARIRDYWFSLLPELRDQSRVLFVATLAGRLAGSGQLWMPQWSTAVHRAEVHKLFVDRALRGRGLGAQLMATLHEESLSRGRSLVTLHTRHGAPPERFYRQLGYRDVGILPGGIRAGADVRHDLITLYQDFAARSAAN